MKHFILLTIFTIISLPPLFSQTTKGIRYQAVARGTSGETLKSQEIGVKFEIRKDDRNGSIEYSEVHFISTNDFGQFNVVIGRGLDATGNLEELEWGLSPFFLSVLLDASGGTNFKELGTSEIIAVPYAYFAQTAGNVFSGDYNDLDNLPESFDDLDADPANEIQLISISNDTIYLENGGFAVLPDDNTEDSDSDPANEIQLISISNDTIYLENGGFVVLPDDNTEDSDSDPSNEIQTLEVSFTGDTIFLSKSNFIIIPGASSSNQFFQDLRDNQTYEIVKIGSQVWIAENLNYYTSSGSWYYDNDSISYASTFGRLYDWQTALSICPDGWHLPTRGEWQILEDFIGGVSEGGKLKSTGTSVWVSPNSGATDEFGFKALPAGTQNGMPFESIGEAAYFWSMTESDETTAYIRSLLSVHTNFAESALDKEFGISCRCIKD